MTEADRTTLFLKYAKANIKNSFAFEAKICKGPSLPFAAVKDHQKAALLRVKFGVFNYKISDVGFDQKPFDGFQYHMCDSYVVIFWYEKRNDRRMTIIPIESWIKEESISLRKSLVYPRSCEIGQCVEL